jgi:hypothetical protein
MRPQQESRHAGDYPAGSCLLENQQRHGMVRLFVMMENIRGFRTVNIDASSILGVRLKGRDDRPDQELISSVMACRVPGGSVALRVERASRCMGACYG